MTDTTEFFDSLAEKSGSGLPRGDYSMADADYIVPQNHGRYTPAQHALWRRLYQRQEKLLAGRACDRFIECLSLLQASGEIPCFDRVSDMLFRATGWRLAAVPGLIPD